MRAVFEYRNAIQSNALRGISCCQFGVSNEGAEALINAANVGSDCFAGVRQLSLFVVKLREAKAGRFSFGGRRIAGRDAKGKAEIRVLHNARPASLARVREAIQVAHRSQKSA